MPVLSAQNISLAFLDKTLFCDVTFAIEKTDRIGLIGANGAGKTTLFRLLLRQLEPTEGAIIIPAGTRIGCVEQHACRDSSKTAYEEVLTVYSDVIEMERELESINRRLSQSPDAALIDRQEQLREAFEARDGLSYRSRARAALLGLGFSAEETDKPVGILSGGQRTKISLAKLLLSGADLILLDEPTNHLDTESVEWLEDFLKKYTGAAMIISHDRYFLDKVTTKTMELQGGRFFFTKGSYSTYQQLKQERLLFESRENEKIEKEIDRLKAMIEQQRRFNRERNYITIASKEKQIARLKEGLHETVRTPDEMRLRFPVASESGNEVLSAQNLSKTFTKPLFSGVSFDLRKGERAFLLGPNGCGKTTLLKMIMGEITPDTGAIRFGAGVRIGYFEQTQSALGSGKTVLQEVYDRFPDKTVPELRKILAAFLFRGDDIDKTMRDLSGGERAKVAVESYDDRIDPVGACVGMKGSRIHGIVRELRNENIDVINYTTNTQLYITRALNPAKINKIDLDEENKKANVYLNPEEVSLAIGKGGLNIKLASQLTGYEIDVYREVEESEEEDVNLDEFADEIEPWIINELKRVGCDTAKSVLELSESELESRTDLEIETIRDVLKILKAEFE